MSVLEYYNLINLSRCIPARQPLPINRPPIKIASIFPIFSQDEADLLQTNIEKLQRDLDVSSKLTITAGDGLKALPDDVAKHDNHHLIVIDPPYETDAEYLAVIDALVKAYQQSRKSPR